MYIPFHHFNVGMYIGFVSVTWTANVCQGIALEFVFWLHLLACYLNNNHEQSGHDSMNWSGFDDDDGYASSPRCHEGCVEEALVSVLYPPSPLLLLPHMLPVAVRLACSLPHLSSSTATTSSSSLPLLCQILGFFQVISPSCQATVSLYVAHADCNASCHVMSCVVVTISFYLLNTPRVHCCST